MAAHAAPAVYDLDAAAGGRAQAALLSGPHDAGGAGPVRGRLHHLHADGLDHPVGRGPAGGPVDGPTLFTARRTSRPGLAVTTRRSRTPRRPTKPSVPPARAFRTPGETGLHGDQRRLYELVWMRTVASQMADAVGQSVVVRLAADRAPASSVPARLPGRRVRHQRAGDHLPGLPAGLRRGLRRPRRRAGRPRGAAPASGRRRPPGGAVAHARGPLDPAACPLHRGVPGQGPGGHGRRPAIDLRHDPGHHRAAGLRVEEGLGAGARPGRPSP